MVLAPHPDDEVIGCGGTLKILSLKNSDIQIIYITNGVPKKINNFKKKTLVRKKEAIDLNKKQNFQNPIFFDLETRKVQHNIKKKTNDLKLILNNLKPELIFVPFVIDRADDHTYTNQLLHDALKDLPLTECKFFLSSIKFYQFELSC